jgi:hypothetical protein
MTHEPRRDELLDLALGLLEPAEARALETHAAGCAACRAELAALRQTREVLAGLPPIEAPERSAAVVLAAARQAAEAAEAARRPRWAAPRWVWGGTLGLAGAAALAVLVLRFSGPTAPGPLSDDREALLGQGAPTAAPPGDAPPSPAKVAAAESSKPAGEPPAGSFAPARRAKQAVGIRGDALGVAAPAPVSVPAPAPTPVAPASAPAPERASPPAAQAPRAELAAEAKAMAPPAAKMSARAAGADADAVGPPCRLEQRRRFSRDATGRVVGRVREGRYPAEGGEVPLTVEERFGPDGRLLGATVRAGDQPLMVTEADVAAGRLEPLPGVVLARTAAEAVSVAPRCEP